MSGPIVYPSTLPNPTRLTHRPNMRAIISDLPGRPALASRERSYSGAADVEWFLNSVQAAEFYVWWNETLARGGYWFNSAWPAILPGINTCQFITEPVFTHVYDGAFRITATLQVRPYAGPLLGPDETPATIMIDFEGLQTYEEVNNFYNGGLGSFGSGPGPAWGIVFTGTMTAEETHVDANFYNEPSFETVGFIIQGTWGTLTEFTLNKPDGFVGGFSFYYCSVPDGISPPPATCSIYSGLDGTGTLLATISMPTTPTIAPFDKVYNHWELVGAPFVGTAQSAKFIVYSNQTGIDDIRFGI